MDTTGSSNCESKISVLHHRIISAVKLKSAFLMLFFLFIVIVLLGSGVEGVGWHGQGSITSRQYRDIGLTDLDGNPTLEVGGVLSSPEGDDPSAEFHSFDGTGWSRFPAYIEYKGIYNAIALNGSLVAGSHAGGNSVDSWCYNPAAGFFEFHEPDEGSVIGNTSLCVAMMDLDNDSYPDIVAGYRNHGIRVFYGKQNGEYEMGTFPKTSGMVKDLIITDLDGDGHLDIVNTHKPYDGPGEMRIEIWLGDGNGNWTARTVSGSNYDYSTIACGDLNGNGFRDIVAGSDSRQGIDRYLYQPAGSFWERSQVISRGVFSELHLAFIDSDEHLDIIGGRLDDSGICVHLGDGSGGFDTHDFGPVQNGDVWSLVLFDLNGDEQLDIIMANTTGLYWWLQARPEIRETMVPSVMYAMHEFYDISVTVTSPSILENPNTLEEVKVRFDNDSTTTFIIAYNARNPEPSRFYVEYGSTVVMLDGVNSSRRTEDDGSITITFRVKIRWAIEDLGSETGGTIYGYLREVKGTTDWIMLEPDPWKIISSVTVEGFRVDDDTRNPGDPVEFSGTVTYVNSTIPVDDHVLERIVIRAHGIPEAIPDTTGYEFENGSFRINATLPGMAGNIVFWPEVAIDPGDATISVIPLPEVNLTVFSDYVMVTDIWVAGEAYFDPSSFVYWQGRNGTITFFTQTRYHVSGEPFEGEFLLTNGSLTYSTANRRCSVTLDARGIHRVVLVPKNNSAYDNPFGPMLVSSVPFPPVVIWDGEPPVIIDYGSTSIRDGHDIKAVDVEVSIIVMEQGSLEPVPGADRGTFTIHWSIMRDVNITSSDSAPMVRGWWQGDYLFSYLLPLSQAGTDDVVLFWFSGNDSVGNEFVSELWPVTCTDEDPAAVRVDPVPPLPPSGLRAIAGDGYIDLRWTPNTDKVIAGYQVYRSTDGETFPQFPISGSEPVPYPYFQDSGLENGRTYYYRITAVDRAFIPNESNFSEIVSATPEKGKPEDLTGLIMENIDMVVVALVMIAIAIQVSVVVIRSRKKTELAAIPGSEGTPRSAGIPGTTGSPENSRSTRPTGPSAFSGPAGSSGSPNHSGPPGYPGSPTLPAPSPFSPPADTSTHGPDGHQNSGSPFAQPYRTSSGTEQNPHDTPWASSFPEPSTAPVTDPASQSSTARKIRRPKGSENLQSRVPSMVPPFPFPGPDHPPVDHAQSTFDEPQTTGTFPPVEWTCPSCSSPVSLGQGERFCTGCGYRIR